MVDTQRRPVAGATIEVSTRGVRALDPTPFAWLPGSVLTDSAGEFTFESLAAGVVAFVHVDAEGFESGSAEVDVLEGMVTELGDLELTACARLVGRVVEDGVGVANVELNFNGRRASSDSRGVFEVFVSPSTVTRRPFVVSPGWNFAKDLEWQVPLPEPGGTVSVGDLSIGRCVEVRGTVVDETGAPVRAASLLCRQAPHSIEAESDETGTFVLEQLFATVPAQLKVWSEETTGALLEISPPVSGLRIELRRISALEVRIVDAHDSTPLTGDDLELDPLWFDAEDPNFDGTVSAQKSADGRFLVRGSVDEPVEEENDSLAGRTTRLLLRASAPGFRSAAREVEIQNGVFSGSLDLALEPRPFLRGIVRDVEGRPVPRARVEMVSCSDGFEHCSLVLGQSVQVSGRTEVFGFTNEEGRFSLELPEKDGSYTIVASGASIPAASSAILSLAELEAIGELVLTAERGGFVEGLVLDLEGSPLPGAWVLANDENGHVRFAHSDAEGFYRIGPLLPVAHAVRVGTNGPNGAFQSGLSFRPTMLGTERFPMQVVIQEGESVRFDLDLSRPTRAGLVVEWPGALPDSSLALRGEGLPRLFSQVPKWSRFANTYARFDLGAGTYQLVFRQNPIEVILQELTLAEGTTTRASIDLRFRDVRGRVSTRSGASPGSGSVRLEVDRGTTERAAALQRRLDPAGRFRFENVLEGHYRLRFGTGTDVQSFAVAGEDVEVDLVLDSTGTVLLDLAALEPEFRDRLADLRLEKDGAVVWQWQRTWERIELGDLEVGEYQLFVGRVADEDPTKEPQEHRSNFPVLANAKVELSGKVRRLLGLE